MSVKNLASVTPQEQEEFVNSFDFIISDVDGVVWLLGKSFPGATEAVEYLEKTYKKVVFLTNNSLLSTNDLKKLLTIKGFGENPTIVNPVLAIIHYLKKIEFNRELYVIGGPPIKKQIAEAGFKIADSADEVHLDYVNYLSWIPHLQDNPNVGGVLIDWDANLTFLKLQKVLTYLKRDDVVYITGATDSKLPVAPKIFLIGPKYFQTPIEDMTGRTPVALGKPSPLLNDYVVETCNITDRSKVLFIGDTINEDMAFASNCGYKKLLVLTGVTKKENVENWTASEDLKPNYYVESLSEFHNIVKSVKN